MWGSSLTAERSLDYGSRFLLLCATMSDAQTEATKNCAFYGPKRTELSANCYFTTLNFKVLAQLPA